MLHIYIYDISRLRVNLQIIHTFRVCCTFPYFNCCTMVRKRTQQEIWFYLHTEKSNKMQQCTKMYYSLFIWSSTCFGRHTAHHQEPKTALAASGFAYVEGCWTCGCWTLQTVCRKWIVGSSNTTSTPAPAVTVSSPLMRRPNTDSTPNKPVTLLRNQLLIRYAVTSPVHTVTIRCYDTR